MPNHADVSLREPDLPALHEAASRASLKAQRTYLLLLRLDLTALVSGALLTSISFQRVTTIQWVTALGALLLVASLIITVMISVKNYEQRWYGGRAVAESVKTLCWRYVSGAEPFGIELIAREADARFIAQLRAILEQSEQLAVRLFGAADGRGQISNAMRQIRALPLTNRKEAYLRERVQEQMTWYTNKAELNEGRERTFFIVIMVVQLAAVAAAIYLVVRPSTSFNFSGLLATLAAALIAWLQAKRHQELAQSYSVAAHELGLIAEQARHIKKEEEFGTFVADAESAISREHTLWVARRDVPGFRRR